MVRFFICPILFGQFAEHISKISARIPVKSITMSDRDVARRLFIQSVWSEIGDTEWGVKDVFNIATTSEDGEGQNILHQFLVGDPKKSLGHLLRAFDRQVFNFDDISLRVRRVENTSPVMYKIERLLIFLKIFLMSIDISVMLCCVHENAR